MSAGVTQADRDAAAEYARQWQGASEEAVADIKAGHHDMWSLVKFAASHRQATEAQQAERIAQLEADRDALVAALDAVLNTSGARERYHALQYVDAVESAEATLARIKGDKP